MSVKKADHGLKIMVCWKVRFHGQLRSWSKRYAGAEDVERDHGGPGDRGMRFVIKCIAERHGVTVVADDDCITSSSIRRCEREPVIDDVGTSDEARVRCISAALRRCARRGTIWCCDKVDRARIDFAFTLALAFTLSFTLSFALSFAFPFFAFFTLTFFTLAFAFTFTFACILILTVVWTACKER